MTMDNSKMITKKKVLIHCSLLAGLVFLMIMAGLHSCKKGKPDLVRITEGFDWELPSNVEVTPNTGFSWIWGHYKWLNKWLEMYPLEDTANNYFAEYIFFDWANVNPQPGVFDFSHIDKRIKEIEEAGITGMGFAIWPRIYGRSVKKEKKLHWTGTYEGMPKIPRWLEDFDRIDNKPEWMEGKKEVAYLEDGSIAAWLPNSIFLDALERLLDTLGAKYKDHQKLAFIEMRYNDSHWGEGGFRSKEEEKARAEDELQLNKENYKKYMFHFLNMWADAFEGVEHKVVKSNWEPDVPGLRGRYYEVKQEVLKHAVELGFGGRDGQVEVWNRYMTRGYGNYINDQYYLIFDDSYLPVKEGRVWFTENEAYIFPGPRRTFGPAEYEEYRWFTSNLRLLQMRRNWVWIKKEACFKWPEITRYMQLSLGKTPETSVDGFCNLREGYKGYDPDKFPKMYAGIENKDTILETPVKNFERWVWQRDIGPDGVTEPAVKIDISQLHQWASWRDYEFKARKTNIKENQDAMYFKVDKNWFSEDKQDVRIFVSYLDSLSSAWQLEYRSEGKLMKTPVVENHDKHVWKTAVFDMPGFVPDGSFPGDMDFRLKLAGENDVIVRLVRVVKWK